MPGHEDRSHERKEEKEGCEGDKDEKGTKWKGEEHASLRNQILKNQVWGPERL